MKIWKGYGSEHSANLVIIGEFASDSKRDEAMELLQRATDVAREDEAQGRLVAGANANSFSDGMMELCRQTNFAGFSWNDPEQLLYDFNARVEQNKLVITTDETNIQAFLKILIDKGARVQLYSAHDYPGQYGRR